MGRILLVEWRRNLGKPAWMLGLAVLAGVIAAQRPGQGYSLVVGVAIGMALRWVPSPERDASDDFLLVRGVVTRRGIVVRSLVIGLVPVALALAVVAVLRASGRAHPDTSLTLLALAALDAYLIGAALVRWIARRPESLAIASFATMLSTLPFVIVATFGLAEPVLAITTAVAAPLALASLFRPPSDARGTSSRHTATLDRDGRAASHPLLAVASMAIRPALGRDTTATFIVLLLVFIASLVISLSPVVVSMPTLLSIWLVLAALVSMMASMIWLGFGLSSTLGRQGAGRGQVEWVLSRPLSRMTLATGVAVGTHGVLAAIAAVGLAGGIGFSFALGSTAPRAAVAAGLLLLASLELATMIFAVIQSAGTRRLFPLAATWCAPFAFPLLLALPEIERALRGESAVLAPWAAGTAVPWIAAHVPLALLALAAASALAHALAYRSFRSYEL